MDKHSRHSKVLYFVNKEISPSLISILVVIGVVILCKLWFLQNPLIVGLTQPFSLYM